MPVLSSLTSLFGKVVITQNSAWCLEGGERLRTLRRDRPYERLDITGIKGLSEAQKALLHALGAFGETNIGR